MERKTKMLERGPLHLIVNFSSLSCSYPRIENRWRDPLRLVTFSRPPKPFNLRTHHVVGTLSEMRFEKYWEPKRVKDSFISKGFL
jgi:hypothetical protein